MVHHKFSRYFLVSACLVAIVAANTQNSTSASQPSSNKVGWEPGPTQRGTLTLVWSCVATIITCTWSILHLNVPAREDGPWTKRFRKVKWMCITILFPEFIFSKAICELKDAVDDTYEIKKYAKPLDWGSRGIANKLDWPVTFGRGCERLYRIFHLFDLHFRAEDGISLNNSDSQPEPLHVQPHAEKGKDCEEPSTTEECRCNLMIPSGPWQWQWVDWTLTHSYLANMGGLIDTNGQNILIYDLIDRCLGLKLDLYFLPSEEEIADRSKADLLVKLLAVSQILWLVLSVAVRGLTGLAVSQLEIATLAFSVQAVATYVANLKKPKDVDVPVKLRFPQTPWTRKPRREDSKPRSFVEFLSLPEGYPGHTDRMFNDAVRIQEPLPLICSIMSISTIIFGGFHCIAWSFDFPSRVEVIIWRSASLVSATVPCIALLGSLLMVKLIRGRDRAFPAFLGDNIAEIEQSHAVWRFLLSGDSALYGQDRGSFTLEDAREAFASEILAQEIRLRAGPPIPFAEAPQDHLAIQPPQAGPPVLADLDVPRPGAFEAALTIQTFFEKSLPRIVSLLKKLREDWLKLKNASLESKPLCQSRILRDYSELRMEYRNIDHSLWDNFEELVARRLREGQDIREGRLLRYLVGPESDWAKHQEGTWKFEHHCGQVSRALIITSGILYFFARVALLVVAFTSLRSVPEDLYTTSWTRFMPYIS